MTKIYWIMQYKRGQLVGITDDGRLVTTRADMPMFSLRMNRDEQEEVMRNKTKSSEMRFVKGILNKSVIDETYQVINEYYETIRDYKPNIKVKSVTNNKNIPPHGPHYVITPPRIQTAEEKVNKVRKLISEISEIAYLHQDVPLLAEKLYNEMLDSGLIKITVFLNKELKDEYFMLRYLGFMWVVQINKLTNVAFNQRGTNVTIYFDPQSDVDIIRYYYMMKEGKIMVNDIDEVVDAVKNKSIPLTNKFYQSIPYDTRVRNIETHAQAYADAITIALTKLHAVHYNVFQPE